MESNINLLYHIERISSEATKCELNFKDMKDIKDEITRVSEFLDITNDQTVLFACLVELSLQRTVTIETLARHLKCNALRVINLIHEFEVLERKKLLNKCLKPGSKIHSYNTLGYAVPHHVIESLRTNDKSKLKELTQFSLPSFLERISEMIEARESNSSATQELFDQIEFLISKNIEHPFIDFINKNAKQTINKSVVFVLAFFRFKKQEHYNFESITSTIFDDITKQVEFEQNFVSGNNELFKNDIIRFKDSQFANERYPILTYRTVKILYKNYPELAFEEESGEGIIKAKAIKTKRLYYDENLQNLIERLTNAISQKNFRPFQERLLDSNLPTGITAIFYGQSGTGKTETVYQIARKTKRDIMMVDLSQVRSKWFGESEKQAKKIFDEYRRVFINSHIKPILFINEADGMFSKRMRINGESSTEQAMNTIQNIILQELERFEGILFATTNLTMNLDSAFERRFLFKIEFKNPHPEISERIWKSKIPELKSSHLAYLVSRYQLSGGEIENVARKYLMEMVIDGKQLNLDRLAEYCALEKPFHMNKRMGFVHR